MTRRNKIKGFIKLPKAELLKDRSKKTPKVEGNFFNVAKTSAQEVLKKLKA